MILDFQLNNAVLLCIKHTKCMKWLLHYYVHDFNISNVILIKKGYIALEVVSLARFLLFVCLFLVRFRFDQTSQMCSLNFNHYCLLRRYDNKNFGNDIK